MSPAYWTYGVTHLWHWSTWDVYCERMWIQQGMRLAIFFCACLFSYGTVFVTSNLDFYWYRSDVSSSSSPTTLLSLLLRQYGFQSSFPFEQEPKKNWIRSTFFCYFEEKNRLVLCATYCVCFIELLRSGQWCGNMVGVDIDGINVINKWAKIKWISMVNWEFQW